ncbi:cytidylate kinase family protein [Candidatus Micrarchaeota archaeon]|nr:cytidylate kinase family protein [Candidatus Micrarchaeota archaeon]
MIICISGLSGSGKTTVGKKLAEKLGYALVCPTFKDLAEKEGISLMEFQKKAENDPEIDRKFDRLLKEMATGNCVVTTWLGPWILDADCRIKVFCPDGIRAERLAKRDGITTEDAIKHIRARDDGNRRRYKKIYDIDIDDEGIFDAVLNSGENDPDKLVEMIVKILRD